MRSSPNCSAFEPRSRSKTSSSARSFGKKPKSSPAFSLVELLVVISLMAIVAGIVLTTFEPSIHDQLVGTAQVVAADIAYTRNLAVTNNSTYKITFDLKNERYVITHTGANSALDILPGSPYRLSGEPPTQQTTDLSRLPLAPSSIDLLVVHEQEEMEAAYPSRVTELEFGPLGETTRPELTRIWLAAGTGSVRRYISIDVSPVTGLAAIGDFRADPPVSREDYLDAVGSGLGAEMGYGYSTEDSAGGMELKVDLASASGGSDFFGP